MHLSSSIFGSLRLHSDMESCAGHLQNQTYSRNRAEKKGFVNWFLLWQAQTLSTLKNTTHC